MEKRGRYSKEFKLEAIRLLNEGDRPISKLAIDLGVKRTLLYRWRDQMDAKGDKAFSNRSGRPSREQESELTQLRRENRELKEDRDILKKAAAYFAKNLK